MIRECHRNQPHKPDLTSPSVQEGRSFWSFQPIEQPAVPEVNDPSWPLTDIDRFVLARLEQNQMRPVGDADRESFIRRVYYDVIGLPPTPQQVIAFVADSSDDAYPKVVDELLQSPQFGQRGGGIGWTSFVSPNQAAVGGRCSSPMPGDIAIT